MAGTEINKNYSFSWASFSNTKKVSKFLPIISYLKIYLKLNEVLKIIVGYFEMMKLKILKSCKDLHVCLLLKPTIFIFIRLVHLPCNRDFSPSNI